MTCRRGGVKKQTGGGASKERSEGEKITKYEIERGDRRDPHLSGIQMELGVMLIEEEERGDKEGGCVRRGDKRRRERWIRCCLMRRQSQRNPHRSLPPHKAAALHPPGKAELT